MKGLVSVVWYQYGFWGAAFLLPCCFDDLTCVCEHNGVFTLTYVSLNSVPNARD